MRNTEAQPAPALDTEAQTSNAMVAQVEIVEIMGPVTHTVKPQETDLLPNTATDPVVSSGNKRRRFGSSRLAAFTLATTMAIGSVGIANAEESNPDQSPTPNSPTKVEPSPFHSMTPDSVEDVQFGEEADIEPISRYERLGKLLDQESYSDVEYENVASRIVTYFEENPELNDEIKELFDLDPKEYISENEKIFKEKKKKNRQVFPISIGLGMLATAYARSEGEDGEDESLFPLIEDYLGATVNELSDEYKDINLELFSNLEDEFSEGTSSEVDDESDTETTPDIETTEKPKAVKSLINGKHPKVKIKDLATNFLNFLDNNPEALNYYKEFYSKNPKKDMDKCQNSGSESLRQAQCSAIQNSALEFYHVLGMSGSWRFVKDGYNYSYNEFSSKQQRRSAEKFIRAHEEFVKDIATE